MLNLPQDLAAALQTAALEDGFAALQPDVQSGFTTWLEHAGDDSLRKRRIERIVAAVKEIEKDASPRGS
ncbi:MAG TPA: YdeI/OmpD-associated family protein [Actinomycetota bacterium]|nr:YdeI/OmpD-associated family protein [Actinomycetota bacterium]